MSSKRTGSLAVSVFVILIFTLVLAVMGVVLYFSGISQQFNKAVNLYFGISSEASVDSSDEVHGESGYKPDNSVGSATIESTAFPEDKLDLITSDDMLPDSIDGRSVKNDEIMDRPHHVSLIDEYLMPEAQAAKLIIAGFRNWAGMGNTELPDLSFFYPRNPDGTWSIPVEDYLTRLIPFSPDEQGMYTIGLANERGGWITAYAFVAVFEETGELLAVSVDYHSDRPQVSLHLRDDRIYYIAQGFFTDEEPVPEHTVLRVQKAL